MTKLTVNPPAARAPAASPSAQVIAAAVSEVAIEDSKGRKILLRRPGVLAQYRLIEALGQSASNGTYVSMCLPLIYVASIDGADVVALGKKSEVEALIQRLDEEGVEAVVNGVAEHFGRQAPDEDKAKLGN